MRAFRIADSRHAIFDGAGAYMRGSRWTSAGHSVIYAAETYAGAILEILVHLTFDSVVITHAWIEIGIPSVVPIEQIGAKEVPGWNSADLTASRGYGDRWYREQRTAVLMVPSVVTNAVEHNILINQEHADFGRISCGTANQVKWDERLFNV